jgi:hypothetical protein
MGQGSYVICEWDSVFREYPEFQNAFRRLEAQVVEKCRMDWHPTKNLEQCYGRLTPQSGQFGRTTILPELFDDHSDAQMAHWRQHFTTAGHQTIISGTRTGNTIPEDFKVAWMGLMLPNKNQHLTEIKYQIGDTKFGRLDLEEIHSFNKPAIIFEDGYLIDEEVSFDLYGYIQGPLPDQLPFIQGVYQRIVMLGACYYKVIDRVLGNCGAAI